MMNINNLILEKHVKALSGTSNPRVPVTRSGTGMGAYFYPSAGMGFFTGIIFFVGTGMGLLYPTGTYPLPS
jgi:hypothetical protein